MQHAGPPERIRSASADADVRRSLQAKHGDGCFLPDVLLGKFKDTVHVLDVTGVLLGLDEGFLVFGLH